MRLAVTALAWALVIARRLAAMLGVLVMLAMILVCTVAAMPLLFALDWRDQRKTPG